MLGFILGTLATIFIFSIARSTKRKNLTVKWWAWVITLLWLFYSLLVVAAFFTLIHEGDIKPAIIFAAIFGVVAVVSRVCIARFLLKLGIGLKMKGLEQKGEDHV